MATGFDPRGLNVPCKLLRQNFIGGLLSRINVPSQPLPGRCLEYGPLKLKKGVLGFPPGGFFVRPISL